MRKRCPGEREWYAWLDGEVAPARGRVLGDHLDRCRRCQEVCDEGRRLARLLSTWEDRPVPPRLSATLIEAARARPLAPPEPGAGWQWPAACLIAGGLALVVRLIQGPPVAAPAWGPVLGIVGAALQAAGLAVWRALQSFPADWGAAGALLAVAAGASLVGLVACLERLWAAGGRG